MFKIETSKNLNFSVNNSSSFGYIQYEGSSKPDSLISIIKDTELLFDFECINENMIDLSIRKANITLNCFNEFRIKTKFKCSINQNRKNFSY